MRKALALAFLLAGCVVHEVRPPPEEPPPPPPPAPAPRLLTEREAVKVASDFARARGLTVARYKARLDGRGRWDVLMKGDRGHDSARVLVDGRSGKVLRAKLKDSDAARDWDQ